ncbi:transposable element Tcb2 transposase [Trichonephila clavipes]|nr:transposable element Tcb2 transposase [Trichonephila clavipes]
MWNVIDWQKVVFSDESRLDLGTDDNRVREWRRPTYDSRSTLIVMLGSLTGQRYVDDILRPHEGPFLNGLSGTIFQQGTRQTAVKPSAKIARLLWSQEHVSCVNQEWVIVLVTEDSSFSTNSDSRRVFIE